jgi:hypothetical protein
VIRKDYLLRLIEQFGRLWARLIGQLRAQMFPAARTTLDQAYQQMLGLTSDTVRILSAEELLARMQFGLAPDIGQQRCLVLSALLAAEGDLAVGEQDADLGAQYYEKALEIVLAMSLQHPDLPLPEYAPTVEQLVAALTDYQLPPNAYRLLLQYYERRGAFAKAEDCLFELHAQASQTQAVAALGEAFYQRLRGYTDAQLGAGDFSRPEVAAGLAAWRRATEGSDQQA